MYVAPFIHVSLSPFSLRLAEVAMSRLGSFDMSPALCKMIDIST
jgi:hypothetical protein